MAEGNSAAGKVSSPDHINVSSKKVFGGARKSATRNACAMCTYTVYFVVTFISPNLARNHSRKIFKIAPITKINLSDFLVLFWK